ncbi:MAG: virulence factor [Gammaproteobacteria bacterium]
MTRLTVIYWRDIPAQVVGQQGRRRHRQELPPRFAVAIDRAAMRAGRGSSSAYLEDWRRSTRRCEGDLAAAVRYEAERLEADFPDQRLEALVKAGGRMPSGGETP